jgi:phenylalanyl-tRNA synthetase beta chain
LRIPLDWVHEYVDSRLDVAQTAEALTMMGLEVEEVEQEGASGSPVLDITVMSNRGDCLSMIGVARELAAEQDLPLKLPSFEMEASGPPADSLASIEILDPDLCYRYAATVIQGVRIGPSPEWMARRLTAAGMRPINNIVDVTNYVMLETGQPLHAFDLRLLPGGRIVVRRARAGESLRTLDGVERQLTPDMLAICDETRPVAVAGVMGGADTEVTGSTVDVLIESACFNGASIRATARALGLPTEASYRFERNVDPGGTARAAMRAAELMRQLAGGTICQGVVDVVARPAEERRVSVRASRASAVLGVDLPPETCVAYLRRLCLHCEADGDTIHVTVPTFRGDITAEIDLIEEIGRIHGFNNLPTTLINGPSLQGKDSMRGMLEDEVRTLLLSMGLREVMTHSIVARDTPGPEGLQAVRLRNALSEDVAEMRRTLVPGLAQTLALNAGRGCRDLAIFEIGRVFRQEDRPVETWSVAGCMMGSRWDGQWTPQDRKLTPEAFRRALAADFYQAKGIVEALCARFDVPDVRFVPGGGPYWRRGHTADIYSGNTLIGQVGEVAPEFRDRLDLKAPAFGFEISGEALSAESGACRKWRPQSRYPATRRDLAVAVAEEVSYEQVTQVIREQAGTLLEEVILFDVYRGEQIGEGRKSIGLSLVFRSDDRTLTDEEISAVVEGIRRDLLQKLNATLRDS